MTMSQFPHARRRRLRYHPLIRRLVRETELNAADFILPLFVRPGRGVKQDIGPMPGHAQLSVDRLPDVIGPAIELGVTAFIFFGIPTAKDPVGDIAVSDEGIVQQALRHVKSTFGDRALLMTDECFCEYTDHGHCGVLSERTGRLDVDNDATLPRLAAQCVSHVHAGADVVAPSGMLDGMVGAIRRGLDDAGLQHVPILSYAAKYASAFYGPFRAAAESPPQFGDRGSYQMDPSNTDEAIREVELDIAEGADMVMVKPAMAYLDIVRRVKDRFGLPTAAYNVSGEFAMVKAAAANGWIDERKITLELLTSIKRAGADMILTYHALEAARWLKSG